MDLHVAFVSDMVVCCCLLLNLLLSQDPEEMAKFLEILHWDGIIPLVDDDHVLDIGHEVPHTMEVDWAEAKHGELGLYLGR